MTQTTSGLDLDHTHGDLVAQLLAQHEQVRAAIYAVAETTTAESRQEQFDALRELLARHETAEEMIVRPLTRGIERGYDVAADRMSEENEGKDMLADLERLDIASVEFARTFEKFALAVLTHAQNEETYEFPLLRRNVDAEKLATAERQLLLAERIAPTHPHPSARSTLANYALGPFASMLDRARDAISQITSS
ncbi:MAG TPA: hemerythrin domain-containing protein [Mycobacteriales bacterium]|nr:hemerythrin domain-containing protein [Mycobacteriales bacterium]